MFCIVCLRALRQRQANELLLWDRPDACFVFCFTRIEAISSQGIAFVGSPRHMLRIVFYRQWGNIRLTNCSCGIAQMHILYYVLHALRQYDAKEFLLWDRPDAWFVLLLHALRRNIGLTSCSCGIPQMHMLYCVLYVFRQSQVHKLLLWDGSDAYFVLSWYACRQSLVHEMLLWYRPAACVVLCFICIEAMSG